MRLSHLKPFVVYPFAALTLIFTAACGESTGGAAPLPATNTPLPEASTSAAFVPTDSPVTGLSAPATLTPPPPVVAVTDVAIAAADDDIEGGTATNVDPATSPFPEGLIGPLSFPEDVNPLTGETVNDRAVLARRPVAIKISNAPPVVRPQAGLNSADLVFEHYAEGGLTRFTAVFYSKKADMVGSIRSGRLIDLEIAQMYDAAFAYSGSSGPLQLMFRNGSFFDRIISPDFGHGGFFRVEDPNKAFEHTLFTSTSNLWAILSERGLNQRPQLNSNMAFSEAPPPGGTPITRLEIRYDATIATWAYDPGSDRYRRWTDGTPHLDANDSSQLAFRNIIAVSAHHVDTDILEDNVAGGHYSIQIQIWGQGPVSIFRNGQRFDGVWRREDPGHMLTFFDEEGMVLPLAPGNSFFQIVPLGFDRLIATP